LPIVFGARLSLSFPFLLSAVPLMTPDFAKGKSANGRVGLRRVWLSDGGLTSNFPIHFFDMPIPSRPTFCLNLVSFESEAPSTDIQPNGVSESADDTTEEKTGHAIAEARSPERTKEKRPPDTKYDEPNPGDKVWEFVSMSRGNLFSPVPFTAFDEAPGTGLISFAKTLVNTARHWSDNQLLIAPGVRDRVVHVALRDDEGGLNLDMKADIIADLDLRGRAAGLLIAARFDPSETIDPETGNTNVNAFANHRWVRFRSFMAAFEDMSRRFASSRDNSDRAAAVRKESPLYLMISGSAKEKLGYPAPQGTRDYYKTFTSAFEKLARDMAAATRNDPHASFDVKGATSSSGAAPRPKMRLTLRPLASKDPRAEHSDLPGTPKT
jgi:hypothetical protein